MSTDDDQIFDFLEVFVWHLAAHLCGAQVLLRELRTASEKHRQTHQHHTSRLYWRSTSLLEDEADTSAQTDADTGQWNKEQRCAFVDAIFEFGLTKPPEIPIDEDAHTVAVSSSGTDAPFIRMRWGSLWLQSSEQKSSVGRYFAGKPVTLLDLEAHFDGGPLKLDLKSNKASVLALQMAECLKSLKPVKGWTDKSLTIPLRYDQISKEKLVPLQVADLYAPSDPIDPCLLDMILLQHSFASTTQSNSSKSIVVTSKEGLAELTNYIENEWKPIVCVGSPEKLTSSPPKLKDDMTAENNESGTGDGATKRKPVPVPTRPVVFRGKGGGVSRVGGKKKKKN